jgi:hypothetical protein
MDLIKYKIAEPPSPQPSPTGEGGRSPVPLLLGEGMRVFRLIAPTYLSKSKLPTFEFKKVIRFARSTAPHTICLERSAVVPQDKICAATIHRADRLRFNKKTVVFSKNPVFTAKVKVEHLKAAMTIALMLFGATTFYIKWGLQQKQCVRMNLLELQVSIGRRCSK